MTDGVVILNSDFNVIHINPSYTQITSFSSSDLIGKKLNFNSISPSLITDIKSAVDKTGNWQGDVTGQEKMAICLSLLSRSTVSEMMKTRLQTMSRLYPTRLCVKSGSQTHKNGAH
ncbi:PAS domain-containing protein [Psychrosphaera algicola]|uniref:PAS domain-containing protein n=1 Tax=Psychrosphaera algicola TaxID=3023714 RepID=A0ABT5FI66_9GAMM|nr:PAS domain-containing protein [Psychrosphaera sp. G1-22]MDC2890881.1 PAS domain-containing protein [Psychrosphaera sp. G1-22]